MLCLRFEWKYTNEFARMLTRSLWLGTYVHKFIQIDKMLMRAVHMYT